MEDVYAKWLVAAAVPIAAWMLGWLVRRLLFGRIGSLLARTDSRVDDLIFEAARVHVPLWFLLLGAVIGARFAPVPERVFTLVDHGATTLFIASMTLVVARVTVALIRHYAEDRGAAARATSLTQSLARGLVFLLGSLMLLTSLGVEIGPLLGALGVGSLAVALALQPTLSNLVAGALITATKKIRPGDFVELDSGQSGFVEDIGWRATQIREPANNLVLIPNSRLADSIVRNHSLPEGEETAIVPVGVAYESDLARVERVTLEVARAVLLDVEGGVRAFEPSVRFHAFGDSAILMNVALRVRHVTERPVVVHEFLKRIHARFQAEGIEIPFPQRDVRFRGPAPRPE